MPANNVVFVDTSVLANLIRVPGRCNDHVYLQQRFKDLHSSGTRFVLPITTIIETGNFVSQASSDRYGVSKRYEAALRAAQGSTPPWTIRDVVWDGDFIQSLIDGAGTGSTMVEHFSSNFLGAGDISILVEMAQFREQTGYTNILIWTLDHGLASATRPI